MPGAQPPLNEAERLEVLREFQILDTPPERAYDDITTIAARLCGTPIALVTFLDADRLWLKARVGTDVEEAPRDVAFCSHAILKPGPLVVPDAQLDERFADNPLVTEAPHFRFYAGAPLVTDGGHGLGTLCVIDHEPRDLDPGALEALQALARQVVALLEMRRVSSKLSNALERVRLMARLLPICAHCKRIREDKEYWRSVESYFREHGGPEFSHGICPDCLRKHFPDQAKALEGLPPWGGPSTEKP